MDSKRFDELIDRIQNGSEDDVPEVQQILQREASQDDTRRFEKILLNPGDNWIQDAIAVPYARLKGTGGLKTLLQAYQVYLGSYSESKDIQNLLTDIVESDPVGSRRTLTEIAQLSDPQIRENATWLLEWSQAETVETPLVHPPVECRIVDGAKGKLAIGLREMGVKAWTLQFSQVHAYRHINGGSFRPLTRRASWIVKLQDSRWSRELLGQAHMHPHPHPGHFVHYQLGVLDTTIDVLCSGGLEFEEVRE